MRVPATVLGAVLAVSVAWSLVEADDGGGVANRLDGIDVRLARIESRLDRVDARLDRLEETVLKRPAQEDWEARLKDLAPPSPKKSDSPARAAALASWQRAWTSAYVQWGTLKELRALAARTPGVFDEGLEKSERQMSEAIDQLRTMKQQDESAR